MTRFNEGRAREIVLATINEPEFLAKPGSKEVRQRYLDAIGRLDYLKSKEGDYVEGIDRIATGLCVGTVVTYYLLDLPALGGALGVGFMVAFAFWLWRKRLFAQHMSKAYGEAGEAAEALTEFLGVR